MPCFTDGEVERRPTSGSRCSRRWGSTSGGSTADEFDALNPAVAPGRTLGSSYAPGDGYIDPPRNVLAYTAALVTQRRRGPRGHRVHRAARPRGGGSSVVHTDRGVDIATERVVLTGGPQLADVGRAAGVRIPAGGARHQVVVTEPHPDLAADRLPMVFDVHGRHLLAARGGRPAVGDEQPGGAAGRGDASSTTTTSR